MFNRARWWSEKNRIKVVFKLQFHASRLAQSGEDGLIISVVPADAGKPIVRSDKASVRDGSCLWENPVFETVKFNQDPKSRKIHGKIYYFVVGTGSSKAGNVGEAAIDFSCYAEATKVSLVSLPLKNSKSEAVLNVSIQRINDTATENREIKESEIHRSHFGIAEKAIGRRNSVEQVTPIDNTIVGMSKQNVNRVASCGSDITTSSSESSSGIGEPHMKSDNTQREMKCDAPTPVSEQDQTSWEWVGNSTGEGSTDDSSSTPRETFLKHPSKEDPGFVSEKLKSDLVALSRQAEKSELELQALRRQIVKENKRGQELWKEIVCLKEERDGLKRECEQFKVFQRNTDESKTKNNLLFDGLESQSMVSELRQELDHANELNANLRIQLQKTQDSNSELILAVRDLEEMLQKKCEIPNQLSSNKALAEGRGTVCRSDDDDDEEQKALEELVKDHSDAKEANLFEQQIMDMHSEIEIYRRDKDEIQMQLEQLALDYEIVRQENHDLLHRLEQCQIQEKLAVAHELETQIENLENELERRSKEYADSLHTIKELKAHAVSLEEELDKQAQGFEADLEVLTRAKVEQEHRAIIAEETLKKLQVKNAETADRLQEELRRLSSQMTSSFEANEKLNSKILVEANKLQSQKSHLEEMLRRTSGEHQSVKAEYEARIDRLANQATIMTNKIEEMKLEIVDKTVLLDYHKRHAEETLRVLSEKNLTFKEEIDAHKAKNKFLLDERETLVQELEQMRKLNKSIELKNRAVMIRDEVDEANKDLNKLRFQVKEKESIIADLQSEIDFLQAQITELKRSLLMSELDKEKLRKQFPQSASDPSKRGDTYKNADKKIAKGASRNSKPLPHGPKEIANLKERIKWLEVQIRLKETALEMSVNSFTEKENDLRRKILELEAKLETIDQSNGHFCSNEAGEDIHNKNEFAALLPRSDDNKLIDKLKTEIAIFKERDALMVVELRDMHERYSEISLRFAEVEGERQQLVIKLRNLANSNKSL
ncbi:uncharacterized protein LOC127250600 isoform X3 [Andrographis paniculata]|uniref:uncharacterized protein LOC127250600 isoform X3 n=1 Tax=Andrographis paniculata TaxID=175694 RepID=UPI0021E73C32|nr:uncharacterized protein LOC127250600 isoform X3 [Andrographis paniculata]